LKRTYFIAVIDSVFCLDARLTNKHRDAISRHTYLQYITPDSRVRDGRTK